MNNCTQESPMPIGAICNPSEWHTWVHHDCTELQDMDDYGIKYLCNSCGIEFIASVYAG